MRAGCRPELVGWRLWLLRRGGLGPCSPVRGPGLSPGSFKRPRHIQPGCPPDVPLGVESPLSLAPHLPSPPSRQACCGATAMWGGSQGGHLTQRWLVGSSGKSAARGECRSPPASRPAPAFVQEAPRARPEVAGPAPALPARCVLEPGLPLIFPCRTQCVDVCYTRASWLIKKASMWEHPVVAEGPLTRFPGCCGQAVCETRTLGHAGAARPARGPALLGKPLCLSTGAVLEERCLSAGAWTRTPKH